DDVAPPEWLVPGVLTRGETCFIAGPMKALKSGVAVDLAVALATPAGGTIEAKFLNHFDVVNPGGHVLLFSGESGNWVTKERIDQIVESRPSVMACGPRSRRPDGWRPRHQLRLTT